VLERQGTADVWDTSDLPVGADSTKEIEKAVSDSDVAVLLISPSFLASDFIVKQELPALLDRRHKEGLAVIPVMVRPSMWSALPEIAELQFANDPPKPLSLASEEERDAAYVLISQRIADIVEAVAERSATRTVIRPPDSQAGRKKYSQVDHGVFEEGHLFVSHSKEDGDFAELLKLRLEREGYDAWVDTDRLDPGLDWRQEIDQPKILCDKLSLSFLTR